MRSKIVNLGALTANAKAFNQNLPTLKRPGLGLVEWSNPKLPAIDWNSSLLSAQLFLRRLLPSSAHVRFTKQSEDANYQAKNQDVCFGSLLIASCSYGAFLKMKLA